MSNENSQNQFNSSSRPWAVYYKQAKSSMEEINSSLLKQLENYEKENMKLKEVLTELDNDTKEKDEALDESHKIITKLNEEYTKLMKEFKAIEQYATELEGENAKSKKLNEDLTKSHSLYEKMQKQNTSQKAELEQIKKDNQNAKKELQNKTGEVNRMEKEIKDKNILISEYKDKLMNNESISNERDKVISDLESKLQEMNAALNKKEEELKVLVKITQEIGNENKSNVEELTKQAINTIKLFYNTLNNNKSSCGRILITNSSPNSNGNIIPNTSSSDLPHFLSKKDIENLIKEKKISFILEEAMTIKDDVLDRGSVPREYIQNMNMKFELLKTELFASLIREMNFVKHLDVLVPKNEFVLLGNNPNSSGKTHNLIEMIIAYFEKQKIQIDDLEKDLSKLRKEYNRLSEQKKELDLYILKVKENSKAALNKMKEKFDKAEKIFNSHVALLKENSNNLNAIDTLNKNLVIVSKDLKTAFEEIRSLREAKEQLENENKELHMRHIDNQENNLVFQENLNKTLAERDFLKYELEKTINKHEQYEEVKSDDFYICSLYKSKITRDLFNMSMQSMDSATDRSFLNKKEENNKLKDEIERLKDEISNLIRSNALNEFKLREFKDTIGAFDSDKLKVNKNINLDLICHTDQSEKVINLKNANEDESIQKMNSQFEEIKFENCQQCAQFVEKCNDFKVNTLRPSNFKDVKQYYLTYQMDLEKIHSKIEEIVAKFSFTESQFANENQEKKIRVGQVREIVSQLQKLVTVFSVFVNKYNKDVYYYTTNLKKLFDFVSKTIYSTNFLNSFSSLMSSNKTPTKFNRLVPVENILKMIYDMNGKVFTAPECSKIYSVYENKGVLEIIDLFKRSCEVIKNNIVDKLEVESELSEGDDSFVNFNRSRNFNTGIKNSYKVVNDRILKLKMFEFDFDTLVEIVKNYLVAQEVIIRSLFSDFNFNRMSNEMISSDAFKNSDHQKNRLDILDKLLYIAEDALFCKSNETREDLIFIRKVTLRLLKNQKFYLGLALDLN